MCSRWQCWLIAGIVLTCLLALILLATKTEYTKPDESTVAQSNYDQPSFSLWQQDTDFKMKTKQRCNDAQISQNAIYC